MADKKLMALTGVTPDSKASYQTLLVQHIGSCLCRMSRPPIDGEASERPDSQDSSMGVSKFGAIADRFVGAAHPGAH